MPMSFLKPRTASWLALALLLAAPAARGQGLSRYEVSGKALASKFNWTVKATVIAPNGGPGTIRFETPWLTLADGPAFEPWQAGVPVRVQDGGNTETVVLLQSACSMGGTGACTATADFAHPHQGRLTLSSGSGGLQEAIDYLTSHGGGTVLLTPAWNAPATTLATAQGGPTVAIENTRSGTQGWYVWSGTSYVPAATIGANTGGVAIPNVEHTVYADQFCATPGQLDQTCLANAVASDTRVVMPAGTYAFSSQLTLTNLTNVVVEGQGAATVIQANGWALRCNQCSNVVFENLRMVSATTPAVVTPAELPTSDPNEMIVLDRWGSGAGYIPASGDDTDIWNELSSAQQNENFDTGVIFSQGDHVRITGLTGSYYSILFYDSSHCEVDHNDVMGGKNFAGAIAFWQVSPSSPGNHYDLVVGNHVSYSGYSGIYVGGGDHYVVADNLVSYAGESGINTGQNPGQQARDVAVTGNVVEHSWYDGFDLSSDYPHTGTFQASSSAVGNVASGDHQTGFYMDGQDWTVSANVVSGNAGPGMLLDLLHSSISDNELFGNNTSGTAAFNQLTVGGAVPPTGDAVTGNQIDTNSEPGYGLYLDAGGATVTGNVTEGGGFYFPSGTFAWNNVSSGQPAPDSNISMAGTLSGSGTFDFSGGTLKEPPNYSNGTAVIANPSVSGTLALAGTCPASQFVTTLSGAAVPSCAQPSASDLSNGVVGSGAVALASTLPLTANASIGGSQIAAGSCADTAVSVPGSATSMVAVISPAGPLPSGWSNLSWSAYVSAAGAVDIRLCNSTAAAVTPAADQALVRVLP